MSDDPFQFLFSLEQFGIKFGLDNIRALVAELGHPERAFRSVHVAGTNGKGSVTAMVDSALNAAGHRSARYTSPHLIDLTERFVIAGQPVSQDALKAVVSRVRDAVRALQERRALDVHPTFFEVTTATAFELFRDAAVEVAVCEVGLGGRLDATNVLSPMLSVITSIDLDHQQYLGSTLADIAAEKAGIVKLRVPVIVGDVHAEAAAVIARIARERDAPLINARDGVTVAGAQPNPDGGQSVELRTPVRDYGRLDLALAGSHQVANAIVAIRILEWLDGAGIAVSREAVAEGLAAVRWRGRLERVRLGDGREALLDAAHNPSGAATLAAFLATARDRRPLVFATMRDKDAREILKPLLAVASAVVLTRASNPRSADPHALAALVAALAPDLPVTVAESPRAALDVAWQRSPQIVIAGSIFLLGDVLRELGAS